MGDVVVVDAVRTPIGKRGGGLSGLHAADLLGRAQTALLERAGVADTGIGQIVAGCVTQAGEQSNNVARLAWLHAGHDHSVAATTIDCACGSSQQAAHIVSGLVASGQIRAGIACGVESMSRVFLGQARTPETGSPYPDDWSIDMGDQFTAAQRIAERRGIKRGDVDAFGLRSQQRARQAWDEGRFDREIAPVTTPDGTVSRDEGLRETSAQALAGLKPVVDGHIHTAGNSSQISDGAAAVLLADEDWARAQGLVPRARIRAATMVGSEPWYHLDGPIDATRAVLDAASMTLADIDIVEINEAFASVGRPWRRCWRPTSIGST